MDVPSGVSAWTALVCFAEIISTNLQQKNAISKLVTIKFVKF